MRKRFLLIASVIVSMLILAGCSKGEIEYKANLGYDFSGVKSSDIAFNVYHTNDADGSWELIKSFPLTPQPGHCNDIRLEGKKNGITVFLKENTRSESEDGETVVYDGFDVSSFDFTVDGFEGFLPGWRSFAIEDRKGEQLVRLYPVSNSDEVSYLEDISLDKPYDTEGETIDNILITVVMK